MDWDGKGDACDDDPVIRGGGQCGTVNAAPWLALLAVAYTRRKRVRVEVGPGHPRHQ